MQEIFNFANNHCIQNAVFQTKTYLLYFTERKAKIHENFKTKIMNIIFLHIFPL
jgi:hypothetical protein